MPDTNTKRIYLDNAATSFPKPPGVLRAIQRFATELGASPGRGSYRESIESGELLRQCRERIAQLINGTEPNHVIFTLNCSDALNLGIKGLLRSGDHAITTQLDHNSILRPLNKLEADGVITQTRLACDPVTGLADPDDLRRAIRPNTRLIAVLHGSNVTGTLQPIEAFGQIAKEQGVAFMVDAAQTLGHMPIDIEAMHIDLLAAPGHKGLLGPLGTGFLYIRPGIEKRMTTVREGGTGSVSESDTQPDFMPDRFEPGSHNTIGLVGLSEGVRYILDQTPGKLWEHEQKMIRLFLALLDAQRVPGLHLYGPPGVDHRCGVFSIRIDGYESPNDLAAALEERFGILTRAGLHCAPGAHDTIGTTACGGTTRLSFGPFVGEDDVRYTAEAIAMLCHEAASVASS